MPPRRVGPYAIVSVIGRGGIGTVYRARRQDTGILVAVKVLGPAPATDATAARRLAREYDVLRALDHPNVVRVYDAGVSEGYSYLAMELVEGLDLRAYLSPVIDDEDLVPLPIDLDPSWPATPGSPPRIDPGSDAIRALAAMMDEPDTDPHAVACAPARREQPQEVCPPRSLLAPEIREALNRPSRMERLRVALGQVADALGYIHGRGLVHRDVKPSNIMVDDLRRARLMDFGLVKTATDDGLTQTGRVVGTYRYMSPEQAQGHRVDARSDLYSLGVILYELLTGIPPFVAPDPGGLWREILTCRPSPIASSNPGADRRLASLAERLLEKDPAKRPQSAEEVEAEIVRE